MKRNIIFLILLVIFGLGSWVFYRTAYAPKPEEIRRLNFQIKARTEKLISAQILAQQLDQVAKLIERNLALSAQDILAEDASMPFLTSLTSIMDQLGITLLALEPKPKINFKGYVKTPYELKIKCSFRQFGQFVNRLEKSERLITVEEFEVDNSVERSDRDREPGKLDHHVMEMAISTLTLIKHR
ncbi:type 4a pilus biogenesis protein PilO [candidate division KSB1 bacterium]|nr:type 4a pilus biogenesis protein PilO [candidate division KSB1 bacterium]